MVFPEGKDIQQEEGSFQCKIMMKETQISNGSHRKKVEKKDEDLIREL